MKCIIDICIPLGFYIFELDQGFQYKAMEFTCPNIYKIQQRELINILVPSPKTKFSLSNLYINKYIRLVCHQQCFTTR